MAHNVLIALHALAGVVCFAAGVLSLASSTARTWRFRLYLASLCGLLLFMAAVVFLDWRHLDATARSIYAGLVGLGLYMLWRATQAATRLRRHDRDWQARYLDHLGFTLISLFDGFVIVAAIDLGAPAWLAILIGVAGVAGGVLAMNRVKVRLGVQPAGS